MANQKSKREVAWRVFATEFNASTVELPGEDQYAPTYLLSPLGAKINRIYITGVLTECENVGTDLEPLWRGRVSDPTDVFYISAGQFQPEAARMLAELEPPVLVGIVGKGRTYSPDETTTYVSVRVELVKAITQQKRDYWVLEACRSLHHRLNFMAKGLKMDAPDLDKLSSLGYSNSLSAGVMEAINQYGSIDIQPFANILTNTLTELASETTMEISTIDAGTVKSGLDGGADISAGASTGAGSDIDKEPIEDQDNIAESGLDPNSDIDKTGSIDVSDGEVPDKSEGAGEDKDDYEISEQLVLEIITSLVQDNPEGVVYEDIQERAFEQGLDKQLMEECIGSLIDKGIIYEPSIGVFKTV